MEPNGGRGGMASDAVEDLSYWLKYASKVRMLNGCLLELWQESRNSHDDRLFPDTPDLRSSQRMLDLAERIGAEDFSVFYGKGLGLHVSASTRKVMRPLMVCQALYADIYHGNIVRKVGNCLAAYSGLKYWLNPDVLADRVYFNARDSQVDFVKSFFNFSEPSYLDRFIRAGNSVASNHLIKLPPQN